MMAATTTPPPMMREGRREIMDAGERMLVRVRNRAGYDAQTHSYIRSSRIHRMTEQWNGKMCDKDIEIRERERALTKGNSSISTQLLILYLTNEKVKPKPIQFRNDEGINRPK